MGMKHAYAKASSFACDFDLVSPVPTRMPRHCRAGRVHSRALWAALLASEAGYSRVLVLSGGHCAWGYDADVRAYAGYRPGEAPPEPEPAPQDLEFPDQDEGLAELDQLELLP